MFDYIYLEINEYYFFYGIKLYCVFVIMGQGLDNRLVGLGFLGIGVYGVEDVVKFSLYIFVFKSFGLVSLLFNF